MKIKISVIQEHQTSYFYYPDLSCKTKDGGMQMLMNLLEKTKKPYTLEVKKNG